MANHINRHFKVHAPLGAADIIFASGVTSLCEMLGYTICDPGDGVLLPRPIYQAFELDFGLKAQVKCIFAKFDGEDQFAPDVVTKYEQAIHRAEREGVKIRALLLCNPHNPLGRCYPKETIIEMMKLCNKFKIHLLSDEIYAMSVYRAADEDAVNFTSVLSFDSAPYIDQDYLHVLYGMSKDFGAGGLRLGCMVIHNAELMRGMSAITQFHWANSLSDTLALAMLEDQTWLDSFFQKAQSNLAEQCQLMRQILDGAGISYVTGATAGFFLWVDLRPFLPALDDSKQDPWERERALAKMFKDSKVFVTPGEGLQSEEPGWFRFVFAADEQTIRAGMKRIIKVLLRKE